MGEQHFYNGNYNHNGDNLEQGRFLSLTTQFYEN